MSALGRTQAAAAGTRPGLRGDQSQFPLRGGFTFGSGRRSQGESAVRFASASGSTPISAAVVQPPPPGVSGAGVGLSTAGPQPGLGAGHEAPGGGTASTQWTLPAWTPPPGWWDMAPAAKKARSAPFFMGEALPLVPGRAVDKILAGDYIDFSELLPDNMELMRRDGERDMAAGWQSVRSPIRRLTSLLSWVQAYAAFAAVVLSHQPDRSTELMAYLRVLVREAQRCGGTGWRAYDQQFRMQAGAYPSSAWTSLQTAICGGTFWSSKHAGAKTPVVCDHCLEADHSTEECALAPAADVVYRPSKAKPLKTKKSTTAKFCRQFNFGKEGCSYGADCVFAHVCAKCGAEGHKSGACKLPAAAHGQ